MSPVRRAASSLKSSFEAGGDFAMGGGRPADADATASASAPSAASSANGSPPGWARRMKRARTMSHGTSVVAHAIRSGDHGGGGASVDLSEGK